MTLYRIKDWDKHFENNRTRELKALQWVPFPNKHDGDGYTELLDHKDGPSHFGAWVAIVQVASRCDERGTLSRAGARPHDAASLSRMTRIPQPVLEAAIKRLVSIGWLEVTHCEHETCEIPHDGAALESHDGAALTEGNGREGKGKKRREEKGKEPPPIPAALDSPAFRSAWSDWVKHRSEIGKPLKPTQTAKQLAEMERWGEERSITAIMHTIAKGWQGLREPDDPPSRNGHIPNEPQPINRAAIREACAMPIDEE